MIASIISRRRRELDLTLAELAEKVGVSEATASRWEKGKIKNLRHDKIVRLASALQLHPTELMGWDKNREFPDIPNIIPLPKAVATAPLLSSDEQLTNLLAVPEGVYADFCLRCQGDAMINARLFDGDIVYIRAQPQVENGEIAAVLVEGRAMLKRVYRYESRLELRAENPTHPAQSFEGRELDRIQILGKAVGFLSNQLH